MKEDWKLPFKLFKCRKIGKRPATTYRNEVGTYRLVHCTTIPGCCEIEDFNSDLELEARIKELKAMIKERSKNK